MALAPLGTITFLGEQQDVTDPEAAVLVVGQTTERQCSVCQQPVDDLSGRTHHVTGQAVQPARCPMIILNRPRCWAVWPCTRRKGPSR